MQGIAKRMTSEIGLWRSIRIARMPMLSGVTSRIESGEGTGTCQRQTLASREDLLSGQCGERLPYGSGLVGGAAGATGAAAGARAAGDALPQPGGGGWCGDTSSGTTHHL